MFMNLDELTAILAAAKKHHPSLFMFMALLGYAGLRPSEALGLKISDIYYLGHVVTEIHLKPTNTKTKTGRDVPVPAPLKEAIMWYLGQIGRTCDPEGWVFTSSTGNPFTIRAFQYTTKRIGFLTLHRKITPKTFRHTYATLLARLAPIRSVQAALGHASLHSTQVYTHPVADDLKNAVNRLFDRTPRLENANPVLPLTYAEGKE